MKDIKIGIVCADNKISNLIARLICTLLSVLEFTNLKSLVRSKNLNYMELLGVFYIQMIRGKVTEDKLCGASFDFIICLQEPTDKERELLYYTLFLMGGDIPIKDRLFVINQ